MLNADSKQLDALMDAFKQANQTVKTVLLRTNAGSVQELKIKLDKRLDKVSLSLTQEAKKWAEKDLPDAYNEGVKKINGRSDRGLHQSEDVIFNSYIELSSKVQSATEHARSIINDAIRQAERNKYGATVGMVKDIIQDTLKKENASMTVRYSNGTQMPLDAYAQMLARTSRIESSNTGSFDRCRKLNIDLVRCTTMAGCCPYCKKYEGKVYSISGNDKRFPSLYDTALQRGYNIMHPNCRHEFIPFVEALQTESELKQIIDNSNHFEKLSKNDVVFKHYNRNQSLMKQWRHEYNEFNRFKKQLGDDMPYSSLGGFRRGARANSVLYRKTVQQYRQEPQPKVAEVKPQPFDFDKFINNDEILNKFKSGTYGDYCRREWKNDEVLFDQFKQKGYAGKPKVVSAEKFDNLSKDDYIFVYRGIRDFNGIPAKTLSNQFKYGKLFCGRGGYGNGTYTALRKDVANSYGQQMLEIAIPKNANIIDHNKLKEIQKQCFEKIRKIIYDDEKVGEFVFDTLTDTSKLATAMGYDAVQVRALGGWDYYIILNRTKVVVKE